MNLLSNFNPLKVYNSSKFIEPLHDMLNYVGDDICFQGDEVGYFFCPLRRYNNASISFSNENFYLFFSLIKENTSKLRKMYLGYLEAFDVDLLQFYEKEIFSETRPYLRAYYTMLLSLLSNNIDGDFCNYIADYDNRIHERIGNLNKFDISNNEIFWQNPPDDKFIISYEKDISTSGILITTKIRDYQLLNEVENLKYYYVR
mgnify:CR=1 FL=1